MMNSINWSFVYGSMSFWICSGELLLSSSESDEVSVG